MAIGTGASRASDAFPSRTTCFSNVSPDTTHTQRSDMTRVTPERRNNVSRRSHRSISAPRLNRTPTSGRERSWRTGRRCGSSFGQNSETTWCQNIVTRKPNPNGTKPADKTSASTFHRQPTDDDHVMANTNTVAQTRNSLRHPLFVDTTRSLFSE